MYSFQDYLTLTPSSHSILSSFSVFGLTLQQALLSQAGRQARQELEWLQGV